MSVAKIICPECTLTAVVLAMGDLDYGLRVRYTGFSVWVMAGFAGTCFRIAVTGSFNVPSLPGTVRLRKMMQPRGRRPLYGALSRNGMQVFSGQYSGCGLMQK